MCNESEIKELFLIKWWEIRVARNPGMRKRLLSSCAPQTWRKKYRNPSQNLFWICGAHEKLDKLVVNGDYITSSLVFIPLLMGIKEHFLCIAACNSCSFWTATHICGVWLICCSTYFMYFTVTAWFNTNSLFIKVAKSSDFWE